MLPKHDIEFTYFYLIVWNVSFQVLHNINCFPKFTKFGKENMQNNKDTERFPQ